MFGVGALQVLRVCCWMVHLSLHNLFRSLIIRTEHPSPYSHIRKLMWLNNEWECQKLSIYNKTLHKQISTSDEKIDFGTQIIIVILHLISEHLLSVN